MPDIKDQMIEEAMEKREDQERVLDEIEAYGERFAW